MLSVHYCKLQSPLLKDIRKSIIWQSYGQNIVAHFSGQGVVVDRGLSRLDYCNTTLAGLPDDLPNYFQSALNAAARSFAGLYQITQSRKHTHY